MIEGYEEDRVETGERIMKSYLNDQIYVVTKWVHVDEDRFVALEKEPLENYAMDFDDYQDKTEETAVYPEDQAIEYLALGLNGEAGEVAEKVKKHIRDGKELDEEFAKELGDCLWYLSRLVDELGVDLSEVAEANLNKLFDRKDRDKIKGDGDNR